MKWYRFPLYCLLSLFFVDTTSWAHPGDEHKLTYLNRLIAEKKSSQKAYIQRAALYTKAGHYKLALADFVTAQSKGNPVLVNYELSIYYFSLQDYEKAAEYNNAYLEIFPDFLPALENKINIARKAGLLQLARESFELFTKRSPYANPGQYLAAARSEISLSTKSESSIPSALFIIDKGIDRFGVVPQLQFYAIELELLQNNIRNAVDRHQTLRHILAESPHWLIRHAELSLANDQLKEASTYLNLAQHKTVKLKSTPALTRLQQKAKTLQQQIQMKVEARDRQS